MQFVELLSVPRGIGEVMYNKIVELMREFDWPLDKVLCLLVYDPYSFTGRHVKCSQVLHQITSILVLVYGPIMYH